MTLELVTSLLVQNTKVFEHTKTETTFLWLNFYQHMIFYRQIKSLMSQKDNVTMLSE